MSDPNVQAPPLPEGDPVNNVIGTPPVLPQGGGILEASTSHQAHGHGVESSDSEDEEFDDARSNRSARRPHHQGTILEPLSITLVYLLTIHRVLATLGRYPNLMEPAIPSGRTRWRSI
jgi:hypothetical protein